MFNSRNTTKRQQCDGRLLIQAWKVRGRMRADRIRLDELAKAHAAAR
jgi:hypothetical protein